MTPVARFSAIRGRRDVFRFYDKGLRQDLRLLLRLAGAMIADWLAGSSEIETCRLRWRLRLTFLILLIRAQVIIYELGCGTVNARLIGELIELSRNELAMLASTLEVCVEQEAPAEDNR